MNFNTLALIVLILAAIPCGLFLLNLFVYRPLPRSSRREEALTLISAFQSEPSHGGCFAISVLIPARNEEKNIRATLAAVLANREAEFEVIVLDDHSTDGTANIVSEVAARDARVRLESAPPLPDGWCGKQHACHVLARLARHPLLVFIDADVRLAPDALARLRGFMSRSGIALASGVPRQELGTFSERLLLPLIHFVLLGFLPMHAMRRTRWPSMSAGCGQLFIARREGYEKCGGHAMLRDSLHDGIKLPRVFRQAGFRTDLFDATDIATCRMYQTNAETGRGLGKNATEGLAAPGTIVPMTVLLLGGQVLPFVLLPLAPAMPASAFVLAGMAAALASLPRLIAAWRFQQPIGSALLHPLGVLALLAIQWHALGRHFAGKPSEWKGRSLRHARARRSRQRRMKQTAATLLIVATLGIRASVHAGESRPLPTNAPACIELRDQFDTTHKLTFPTTNITLLTIADKKGAAQLDAWIAALVPRYARRIAIQGLADVGGAPGFVQGRIRKGFQETRKHPVMLDWSGKVCAQLGYQKDVANILVLDGNGVIQARFTGAATPAAVAAAGAALDKVLSAPSK